MEGSRHEKAVLVSVAYLIGALTIFIGLQGNKTLYPTTEVASLPELSQPAAVLSAFTAETESRRSSEISSSKTISYTGGVLTIETLVGTKILSFNPELSGFEISADFLKQGVHTGTLIYSTAADDTYVFFCEQKSVPEACDPFIYDSLSAKVYPVTLDSVKKEFSIDLALGVSWSGKNIVIPGLTSVNSNKPWLLLSQIAQ